ncbi:hypothetical protein BS78_K248200 [Paspalum vaginatum]|uniref:Uncharacterized protein n=1 Tax=Paspalum vaginatum TaxID=158149 RepID=A0A9W8CDK2_9POAL|nr:hypothetical protein BS78_K248200 [Paspalum vaginatum]
MEAVAMEVGTMPAPSSGWLVQRRTARPVKEVAAAVSGGDICANKPPKAAPKEAEEAGAGTKAAAGKKRTKKVRVKQEYIDGFLKQYPFNLKPFPGSREEIMKTISNPVIREQLCAIMADSAARVKASRDKDEAILTQYFANGYAEEEASDDEK